MRQLHADDVGYNDQLEVDMVKSIVILNEQRAK
jgi:hypothetical protein